MKSDVSSPAALQRPTRVRYGVLGFACALSMITYLDRVCIASAVSPMMRALGLTSAAQLDWAFAAFAFAYALFEIPSGWLGDVYGPRRTLIRIVLWWSLFTALTGMTGATIFGLFIGLPALIVVRFLFGMGEAGAYPNITRALHNWFPFRERGLAQGSVWMAGRLMGGLTPLLWLVLVEGLFWSQTAADGTESKQLLVAPVLHWRATFLLFGVIGIVWCVLFSLWFRNRPEQKPTVNEAELALIQQKIRPEGWIILNDYLMTDWIGGETYGVVQATNEFMIAQGWEMLYFALHTAMYCDVVLRRVAPQRRRG